MKVYVLYESYYGNILQETGESTGIIGVYKDKKVAIEKAKYNIEQDTKCNNYVLDKEIDNVESKLENSYVTMFYDFQENWGDYYEITIKEMEVE